MTPHIPHDGCDFGPAARARAVLRYRAAATPAGFIDEAGGASEEDEGAVEPLPMEPEPGLLVGRLLKGRVWCPGGWGAKSRIPSCTRKPESPMMADPFSKARERAKKTLQGQWQALARTRTLGWAGPVEVVVERYPFIRNSVTNLGSSVVREFPLFIFQSRESPPKNMEVAVPYRDASGNPFNSRVVSSAPITPDQVLLRCEVAQAVWFLIEQKALPSPGVGRALQDALLGWTGRELFEL